MVGFELARFVKNNVSILPEHICKVCQLVMNNPVQCTKCKIWICNSCIENACTHCECNHTFTETNKFMKNKIDELTIKCIYCNNGCQYFCKVAQIEKHEKNCEFKLMICQSKNCIKDSTSSEIKHAKDCGLFPMTCEICKKTMRQMELKTHRCIEFLLETIENFEKKNKSLAEENTVLRGKNEISRQECNLAIAKKENKLRELTEINEHLTNKNNLLKQELEGEIVRCEAFYNKELGKFYENSKNRLKNFGKTSLNESSVLGKKMNREMENLLIVTNESLSEFNSKVALNTNEKFNINVEDTVNKLNETRSKK